MASFMLKGLGNRKSCGTRNAIRSQDGRMKSQSYKSVRVSLDGRCVYLRLV
ncbi:hypothetical protein Goshw_002659 [Gossypium schwendimanii]|uniref:Uncharacterized protein n=1 Tax=Gossypium schwendimanii TaxID=34291 RepID=A0A7J9KJ37_GOSSC|nr:hypothetical protein [Gossypium schwendimanii]